jgi:hypothetical protein
VVDLALSGFSVEFSEVRQPYAHDDVDHFRAKKEAKTEGQAARDGYWWLALDYMNFRLCANVGNRNHAAVHGSGSEPGLDLASVIGRCSLLMSHRLLWGCGVSDRMNASEAARTPKNPQ